MQPNSMAIGKDLSAGMVVFLVALPLCLGIALASQAPIISGLLSGIVGGLVIGAFSGSQTSVSGPAAGLTAVVATQIATLGSFEAFLVALFLAGIVQILMGLWRAGLVAAFFPTSVIKGLLFAIGFILILKQLPHLVGLDRDFEGEMSFFQPDNETTFTELFKIFSSFHLGALAIGLGCLLFLIAWDYRGLSKKIKIPSPLLVVIIGTLCTFIFDNFGPLFLIAEEHRVSVPVVQSILEIKKLFIWPDWQAIIDYKTWSAALTLAVVASLETLLNLEAIDKLDPHQRKSPPNRELIAQGIGNTVLGLIGGLPATSVIVRSSVNINAQAQSKMSAIFHGLLLCFSVLILPTTINKIPLSCLASILIITGFKLASPKIFIQTWRQGISQFLPFLITFLTIVFTDLLVGVFTGLFVSLFFILKSSFDYPIKMLIEQHLAGQIKRIVLANQVSFLNRAALLESFNQLPDQSHVVLDASDTDYIDSDVLELITEFKDRGAKARNIAVSTVGFKSSYQFPNAIQYVDYATLELQKKATPQQVLKLLLDGNARVREGYRLKRDLNRQMVATSEGQFPLGVILSCMDSRVPVELIFDQGIGDVFSIRMAGHVVSERVLGSLEYACAVAGAKLIVVMGHTKCGAIAAALHSFRENQKIESTTGCHNLGSIINDIQTVIKKTRIDELIDSTNSTIQDIEHFIIKENVRHTIKNISIQSSIIASLLQKREIDIVGCIYDITSGSVQFLQDVELKLQRIPQKIS